MTANSEAGPQRSQILRGHRIVLTSSSCFSKGTCHVHGVTVECHEHALVDGMRGGATDPRSSPHTITVVEPHFKRRCRYQRSNFLFVLHADSCTCSVVSYNEE